MRSATKVHAGVLLVASGLVARPAGAQTGQDQASRSEPILDGGAWSAPSPPPTPSWFYVPPMEFTMGPPTWLWAIQFYGFAEFDAINDSTRGFNEGLGNGVIPRNELLSPGAQANTQLQANGDPAPNPAGVNGRTQLTARNSRLGVKLSAPRIGGIKPSALFEMDFFGVQPPDGTYSPNKLPQPTTESNLLASGTFHMRHAYLKLENDYVSILAGQTYDVFGFQNYFFPATTEFFPMPNQVFARNPQLRLYHTIKTNPLDVDVVVAAVRPPQRDSALPSGEAGLLFKINHWKGIHTPGSLGTAADPMAVGVSGTLRHFKVDNLDAVPAKYVEANGWGISLDALIPVIPAVNSDDRGNKLTLTGSFTMGTAYQDLVGNMTMGIPDVRYPPVPGTSAVLPPPPEQGVAAVAVPQATFPAADIDPGLLVFDFSANGTIHTINYRSWMIGFQYYVPGGRFFVTGNYTHGESNNIVDAIGGAAITQNNGLVIANPFAKTVFKDSNYVDANLFFDIAPSARIGTTASLLWQTYADRGPPNLTTTQAPNSPVTVQPDWPINEVVRNIRYRLCFFYYF
jgi:hypothetical protein